MFDYDDCRFCGMCKYADELIYLTNPPQVRCMISGAYKFVNEACDIRFEEGDDEE